MSAGCRGVQSVPAHARVHSGAMRAWRNNARHHAGVRHNTGNCQRPRRIAVRVVGSTDRGTTKCRQHSLGVAKKTCPRQQARYPMQSCANIVAPSLHVPGTTCCHARGVRAFKKNSGPCCARVPASIACGVLCGKQARTITVINDPPARSGCS